MWSLVVAEIRNANCCTVFNGIRSNATSGLTYLLIDSASCIGSGISLKVVSLDANRGCQTAPPHLAGIVGIGHRRQRVSVPQWRGFWVSKMRPPRLCAHHWFALDFLYPLQDS